MIGFVAFEPGYLKGQMRLSRVRGIKQSLPCNIFFLLLSL